MSDQEREGELGELIDRRVQVYGNPVETFARIAQVWSGIIGHEIQPCEVPLMMAGMKMVRAQVMPDYSDNSDDIDGYLDIFRKIIGEDMIHARTVNEFIEKKWPAEPTIMVCHAHGVPIGFCATCNPEIREYTVDEPVPYQVVERDAPTVYTHKSGLVGGQDRVCFWMAKDKEWVFQYPGTGELTSCDLEHQ